MRIIKHRKILLSSEKAFMIRQMLNFKTSKKSLIPMLYILIINEIFSRVTMIVIQEQLVEVPLQDLNLVISSLRSIRFLIFLIIILKIHLKHEKRFGQINLSKELIQQILKSMILSIIVYKLLSAPLKTKVFLFFPLSNVSFSFMQTAEYLTKDCR